MFDLGRQFGDADGMAFKVTTIRPFDMSFAAPSLMPISR